MSAPVSPASASPAQGPSPISAIEWLSSPAALPKLPVPAEPPVSRTATAPDVAVTPLDEVHLGAVGLLPQSVTGLPGDIWQRSQSQSLIRQIAALDVAQLPAMQSLLYTLLLAEAEPPADAGRGAPLLMARIDKLTELGAVNPALALIERAGPESHAGLFHRWFDLSLLAGQEDIACGSMRQRPDLAPSYAALVYCQARGDDWNAAAVTLVSAGALGDLTSSENRLLGQYLDPALAEEAIPLPPPAQITPLIFALQESIGQPINASSLPRPYAMSDLRGLSGWRAELEAAERLAQTGAMSENRLLGLYTDRRPAASGGIWDRVQAVQRFDRALQAGDTSAISTALGPAYRAMADARLEVPFARLYGPQLRDIGPLPGPAGRSTAYRVSLLSPGYEATAGALPPETAEERFLAALASGAPGEVRATSALGRAVAAGFDPATQPPAEISERIATGHLGEAILRAMALYGRAANGDLSDTPAAIASFRAVGLEDTARQAALQLLLLDRRG
ncbi:hypothetical protein [Maritimibacter alkaliphilus]|uniref:hypothetical protein n=1 Tax=Maritimibacter alkaliphilus TaxID=404236 RepID=UPI001C98C14D|nr:hypothetical protein [Maritimibacter alkaliphilus]MBY6089751.1 hypothetical protein [Maritimibacter alkaliphilus]